MIQASIATSTLSGYANLTKFSLSSNSLTDTTIQKYVWSFGDGTFLYDTKDVEHIYASPGNYTITLDVWDENDIKDETSININITNIVEDGIYFSYIPENFPGPGNFTEKPFTVTYTTSLTALTPVIDFYADSSRSIPAQSLNSNTWKELAPRWRFLDSSKTVVTQITATDYSYIYYNKIPVGLSGTVNFYYIDDRGISDPFVEDPVTIFVTLQTRDTQLDLIGTQNSLQKATLWYVDKPVPTNLQITENIIKDIKPLKWSGIEIPYVITANYNKTQTFLTNNYEICAQDLQSIKNTVSANPIVFDFPQQLKSSNFSKSITNNISSDFKSYESYILSAINGLPTGGFFQDEVTIISTEPATAQISATLLIPFSSYDNSVFTNAYLPVINTENAVINKTFSLPYPYSNPKYKKLAYDKILETEWIVPTDLSTVPLSTLPSNLYSIATDPVTFEYFVTDPDKNKIYHFDKNFNIIKEISLYNVLNPPSQVVNLTVRPLHISLDKERNIWLSLYNSLDLVKIDRDGNLLKRVKFNNYSINPCGIFESTLAEKRVNGTVFSLLDLDQDNNIWSTHTDIVHNELRKYDGNGNLLLGVQLSSAYTPTAVHVDKKNNVWIASSAASPFLLKPSQDKYEYYWNWYNLARYNNNPRTWTDTRYKGLSNDATGLEIYPAGKYAKQWQRESYAGDNLIVNQYSSQFSYVTAGTYAMLVVPQLDIIQKIKVPGGGPYNNLQVYPLSTIELSSVVPDYHNYTHLEFELYDYDSYVTDIYNINNIYTRTEPFTYDTIIVDSGAILNTDMIDSTTPCVTATYIATSYIQHTDSSIKSIADVLSSDSGIIYNYDTDGNFIQQIDKTFSRINNIISDKDNNIWVTHNYNHISVIDQYSNTTTWKLDDGHLVTSNETLSAKLALNNANDVYNVHSTGFRGLHSDFFNRIWLVSNIDLKTYNFYAPDLTSHYRTHDVQTSSLKGTSQKLIQSFGDPTGASWYNKFILPYYSNIAYYLLSGVSSNFTVKPFTDTNQIFTKNENFDAAGQLKSLALPEHLSKNTALFDRLFRGILGDVNDSRQGIGKDVYSNIANFTNNQGDIDTANINTLFSMSSSLDLRLNFDKITYPYDIKRILNIISVPYKKVFGVEDTTFNFNIANKIKLTINDTVYPGDKLYVKFNSAFNNISSNNFFIVPDLTATGLYAVTAVPPAYPLSSIQIPILQDYTLADYDIYRINYPITSTTPINSIIDWDNPNTLISEYLPVSSWYGDDGVIEEIVNYILTKNLLT